MTACPWAYGDGAQVFYHLDAVRVVLEVPEVSSVDISVTVYGWRECSLTMIDSVLPQLALSSFSFLIQALAFATELLNSHYL